MSARAWGREGAWGAGRRLFPLGIRAYHGAPGCGSSLCFCRQWLRPGSPDIKCEAAIAGTNISSLQRPGDRISKPMRAGGVSTQPRPGSTHSSRQSSRRVHLTDVGTLYVARLLSVQSSGQHRAWSPMNQHQGPWQGAAAHVGRCRPGGLPE